MRKSLHILLMVFSFVWSSNALAEFSTGELDYVPGELLIVLKQGAVFQSGSTVNMTVIEKRRHGTPFIRVRLDKGSDVMASAQALSAQSWVAHAQPNYIGKVAVLPNDPMFSEYWGLKNSGQTVNAVTGIAGADISVASAWDVGTNCSSVTVAVLDTGVSYNHPDLAANIWSNTAEAIDGTDTDGNGFIDDVRGWDFIQGDNTPLDFNQLGHGTHVAGTIGAVGNNGVGGTGVCWNAKIMPVRVLNSAGSGTTAEVVAGIDYAVANGAKVINMSLTFTGGTAGDLLDTAIANANTASALVIAAAGNSGVNIETTKTYPSAYTQPNIISVAATDQIDGLASFSNFGSTSVDVAAPGVNVKSMIPPARTNVAACSWNFDTGAATGWTLETRDNLGNLVANTVAVTNEDSASPSFSLTDTPGGNYTNNRSYQAISPACDLTGKEGALISFNLNAATETLFDILYSDVSIDGGTTWTNSGAASGNSGGWIAVNADAAPLDGLAAGKFRFRLDTDVTNVADGFHVDDVAITIPGTVFSGTEYGFLSGTSMATPHVAGLAALVMAAEPALTHLQVRTRILNTGDVLASLAGKTATGRRVNAQMSMPITAPTALAANVVSSSRVDLSWTDSSVSEENFLIVRDSGAGFITIATLPANTQAYSDTAAPANSNLTYRIAAQNRENVVAFLPAGISATTPAAPPVPAASGGGGGAMGLWSLLILFGVLLLRRFSKY